MTNKPDIICIGSVLWDIIGRAPVAMGLGNDVGGRIQRIPGGVAMNIAMTLLKFSKPSALITAIGDDAEGKELMRYAQGIGLNCDFVFVSDDLPTDSYMAIEGTNGVIAAIADAHTLEDVGDAILAPLSNGGLGRQDAPYEGLIALDGNLTAALLTEIASATRFRSADLRVAPASPGKADRLQPFISEGTATLYVNKGEAETLTGRTLASAQDGAETLVSMGCKRALVTDGATMVCDATLDGSKSAVPPKVQMMRLTGAGDTFMAAHIAAELDGLARQDALNKAALAAATYVSGADPE